MKSTIYHFEEHGPENTKLAGWDQFKAKESGFRTMSEYVFDLIKKDKDQC